MTLEQVRLIELQEIVMSRKEVVMFDDDELETALWGVTTSTFGEIFLETNEDKTLQKKNNPFLGKVTKRTKMNVNFGGIYKKAVEKKIAEAIASGELADDTDTEYKLSDPPFKWKRMVDGNGKQRTISSSMQTPIGHPDIPYELVPAHPWSAVLASLSPEIWR